MSRSAARMLLCATCILFSFSANAFDLNGKWATDPSNCGKIFKTKNNRVSFARNSDVFGSSFIVEGNEIRGPAKACKITNRKEQTGVVHLIASCNS